jgi:ABC-type sulfate transport system permease subunit
MSKINSIVKKLSLAKIDIFGRDSLMMTSLPYYTHPLILGISYFLLWNNAWSLAVFIYAVMPLLD